MEAEEEVAKDESTRTLLTVNDGHKKEEEKRDDNGDERDAQFHDILTQELLSGERAISLPSTNLEIRSYLVVKTLLPSNSENHHSSIKKKSPSSLPEMANNREGRKENREPSNLLIASEVPGRTRRARRSYASSCQ